MGQIFSDEAPKKRDKCIHMHYIGKSYATSVYKCDDKKKITPSLSETTVTFVSMLLKGVDRYLMEIL